MKLKTNSNKQILEKIIYKLYIPIVILFLIIVTVCYFNKIGISVFTRDPAVIASDPKIIPLIDPKHNPFIGIISQIGILFWCITASLCIFCSFTVSLEKDIYLNLTSFFRYFGYLTSFLLLDDLLMLHESIFPELLKIPEEVTYSGYAFIGIWGLIKFRKTIMQTEWIILLLSFFWFFCSILTDLSTDTLPFSNDDLQHLQYLLEDGFKLLGIVSWFYYFLRVCLNSIKVVI